MAPQQVMLPVENFCIQVFLNHHLEDFVFNFLLSMMDEIGFYLKI
jgi:hypothetical protein